MSATGSFVNPRRGEVLRLYKKLFRAPEKMPTTNRVGWVKAKTQRDFRKYKDLTDEKEIDLYLIVGETNLDSVEIQAAHLTSVFNTDWDAEANRAFQPPPGHDELPDPSDAPPRRDAEKEEDAERS